MSGHSTRETIDRRIDLVALLLLTAVLFTTPTLAQTCYFPDGTPSPGDLPCTSATNTHCCNNLSLCLSNGFCMSAEQQPYVLSRGSCTDLNWGPDCPQKCKGTKDLPGSGIAITLFGSDDNGEPTYCCGTQVASAGKVVCPNNESPFTIDTGRMLFSRGILVNTINATDAQTNNGSSSCNSTTAASRSSDSSSESAKVGAGVGIPLGILALTALAWAMWERRKRMREVAELKSRGAFVDATSSAAAGVNRDYKIPAQHTGYSQQGMQPQHTGYSQQSAGGYNHQTRAVELENYGRAPQELHG